MTWRFSKLSSIDAVNYERIDLALTPWWPLEQSVLHIVCHSHHTSGITWKTGTNMDYFVIFGDLFNIKNLLQHKSWWRGHMFLGSGYWVQAVQEWSIRSATLSNLIGWARLLFLVRWYPCHYKEPTSDMNKAVIWYLYLDVGQCHFTNKN